MKCHHCGKELGLAARFCGACGTPVERLDAAGSKTPAEDHNPAAAPTAAPQTDGKLAELREGLHRLAQILPHFAVSPIVVEAVLRAADGPGTDHYTTVVLGEKDRGKTTLINRLLRRPILPTSNKGMRKTVRLRVGAAWQAFAADAPLRIAGPPFDAAVGVAFDAVEGPALVLAATTLVDTPGMNDADEDFDAVVLSEALAADLVVVCLSATQLLSERERILIRKRLLPVTACGIILAVTHADLLLTAEDRAEIEERARRFVERTASPRLSVVFVSGGTEDSKPAPELEDAIVRAAESAAPDRVRAWARRTGALLAALNEAAGVLPETAAPEGVVDTTAEQLALLEHEHGLALAETEAEVRSRLAGLRLMLPQRFVGMSLEKLQHEGLAELTGEVQAVGREAGAFYLDRLERGLTCGRPDALNTTARGLSQTAAGRFSSVATGVPLDLPVQRGPAPDPKAAALARSCVLLLAISRLVPQAALGAALAFYAGHRLRVAREAEFARRFRDDAAEAVRGWLLEAEADFVKQLRAAGNELFAALRQRVLPCKPKVSPAGKPPTRAEFQSLIRQCLDGCQAALEQGELR